MGKAWTKINLSTYFSYPYILIYGQKSIMIDHEHIDRKSNKKSMSGLFHLCQVTFKQDYMIFTINIIIIVMLTAFYCFKLINEYEPWKKARKIEEASLFIIPLNGQIGQRKVFLEVEKKLELVFGHTSLLGCWQIFSFWECEMKNAFHFLLPPYKKTFHCKCNGYIHFTSWIRKIGSWLIDIIIMKFSSGKSPKFSFFLLFW